MGNLQPGGSHHRAFVGIYDKYDQVCLNQFNLLGVYGLRANSVILDYGCGSLRLGRLLIPLLDQGQYVGVEPEKWLVEAGIKHELGLDMLAKRKEHVQFLHNLDDWSQQAPGPYDFIMAHSIFTHLPIQQTQKVLETFASVLKSTGAIFCTWRLEPRDSQATQWTYPACIGYNYQTIRRASEAAGLVVDHASLGPSRAGARLVQASQELLG